MRPLVVLLAIALDWLVGELPNEFHPVAWFGRFAQALERRAPRDNPRAELLYGAGIAASGGAVSVLPALILERILGKRGLVGLIVLAAILKAAFSWRALLRAGEIVQHDLEQGQLDAARSDLRALVSRETSRLNPPLLAGAAIESLAENASDSFIAPLFYYHLFGLPGAFAYRAINTLDSMIGYHGRYEYLGKISARLDDVLNWIPARLTALLIVLAAPLAGGNPRHAWQALLRDHHLTASPNAGYPMSAMAGALGVRLEKVGHYCLNEEGHTPKPREIHSAARVVSVALGLAVAASVLSVKSNQNRKPENPTGRSAV